MTNILAHLCHIATFNLGFSQQPDQLAVEAGQAGGGGASVSQCSASRGDGARGRAPVYVELPERLRCCLKSLGLRQLALLIQQAGQVT
eukprot:g7431.t1